LAREFGFPVTTYQSTYYSLNPLPVFPVMLSYLLWKARGRHLTMEFDGMLDVELRDDNRAAIASQIVRWTLAAGFDAQRKDALLHRVARALDLDYAAILQRRIMQLMTLEEIRHVSTQPGVSVQLHTHRHNTPAEWRDFADEINRNREILAGATGHSATHFCYPSGRYQEQYFEWLPRLGVRSAVTCQPGLATANQNPFALSRFIDAETVSENVFRAWISGVAELLPRRSVDHSLERSPIQSP
jgi:hypothetical protein